MFIHISVQDRRNNKPIQAISNNQMVKASGTITSNSLRRPNEDHITLSMCLMTLVTTLLQAAVEEEVARLTIDQEGDGGWVSLPQVCSVANNQVVELSEHTTRTPTGMTFQFFSEDLTSQKINPLVDLTHSCCYVVVPLSSGGAVVVLYMGSIVVGGESNHSIDQLSEQ